MKTATTARTISNAAIPPMMPPISAPSIEEDIDNAVVGFKSSSVLRNVTLIVLFALVDSVVADDTSVFVVSVVKFVDIVIVVLVVAPAGLWQMQLVGEFEQSNRFESPLARCNTLIDQES